MSTEKRFTPGPWLIAETDRRFVYALNEKGHNRFFAHVQDPHTYKAELEATAALIASAPDMYAALEAILSDYENNSDTISNFTMLEIEAALKKARGEA